MRKRASLNPGQILPDSGKSREAMKNTEKNDLNERGEDYKHDNNQRNAELVEIEELVQLSDEYVDKLKGYGNLPGVVGRTLAMAEYIELAGYLKDHRPHFKHHWISSKKSSPSNLKASLQSLFETELIYGSLLIGVISSVLTQLSDDSVKEAITEINYKSYLFWWGVTGAFTTICIFIFIVMVYILVITTGPISTSNFWAVSATKTMRWAYNCPSMWLLLSVYGMIFFLNLTVMKVLGGSWFALSIALVPTSLGVIVYIPLVTTALNLAMKSGCYSEVPIFSDKMLMKLSSEEIETVLFHYAKENANMDIIHDDGEFYRRVEKGKVVRQRQRRAGMRQSADTWKDTQTEIDTDEHLVHMIGGKRNGGGSPVQKDEWI